MSNGGRSTVIVQAAIVQATPGDMDVVRALFREYAAWLGVDLGFQGFERELASLPGAYAPPAGGLWLARVAQEPAGVVALRPTGEHGIGEIKRLWLRPDRRGSGLGRGLLETAIARARDIGYRRIVLDTLPPMTAAASLYRAAGFRETAPYYDNPVPGAVYMALDLSPSLPEDR